MLVIDSLRDMLETTMWYRQYNWIVPNIILRHANSSCTVLILSIQKKSSCSQLPSLILSTIHVLRSPNWITEQHQQQNDVHLIQIKMETVFDIRLTNCLFPKLDDRSRNHSKSICLPFATSSFWRPNSLIKLSAS